jgi:hypothetical protein
MNFLIFHAVALCMYVYLVFFQNFGNRIMEKSGNLDVYTVPLDFVWNVKEPSTVQYRYLRLRFYSKHVKFLFKFFIYFALFCHYHYLLLIGEQNNVVNFYHIQYVLQS